MRLAFSILVALTLTLGCGDSDGGGGNGGGDADASTGTVQSCAEMCSMASGAGSTEGTCAANEFQSRGYDLLSAPVECAAIAGNETGCNACMAAIAASDSDCAAVAAQCL